MSRTPQLWSVSYPGGESRRITNDGDTYVNVMGQYRPDHLVGLAGKGGSLSELLVATPPMRVATRKELRSNSIPTLGSPPHAAAGMSRPDGEARRALGLSSGVS